MSEDAECPPHEHIWSLLISTDGARQCVVDGCYATRVAKYRRAISEDGLWLSEASYPCDGYMVMAQAPGNYTPYHRIYTKRGEPYWVALWESGKPHIGVVRSTRAAAEAFALADAALTPHA